MKNNKGENARKALKMAANEAISKSNKTGEELSIKDVISVADNNLKLLENIRN